MKGELVSIAMKTFALFIYSQQSKTNFFTFAH